MRPVPRFYRILLRLLAEPFREEYERAIRDMVADSIDAAPPSLAARASLTLALIWDVLRCAPRTYGLGRTIRDDVHHGWRVFLRFPGVYGVALATLAVGIAATTTMFSVVDAVLLRPLPYAQPDRLALIWDRTGDSARNIWLSPPEFADVRARASAFADAAAMTDHRFVFTGHGDPEELLAVAASPNVFSMLGVTPAAGRLFTPDDEASRTTFALVTSEDVADRVFGSAASAVGRSMTLDGQSWTVVGVLPRRFVFWPPSPVFPSRVDVWVPIDRDTYTRAGRNQNFLHALVRLRPGVDAGQASSDLDRVSRGIERDYPETYRNRGWRMVLVPLRDQLVGPVRPALEILLAAVVLLLVIACANVGNLLLARASARQQEMAVRVALGAGRLRLLRQLLTESAVLAVGAAIAGTVLAAFAVAWIASGGPGDIPRLETAAIDRRVLAVSIATALASAVAFGIAPAWQLSRADPGDGLRSGRRGATTGPRARRVRYALVVTQIALAVVLTVSTGLLVKGFMRLGHVDTGFVADGVASGRLRLPAGKYPRPEDRAAFFARLTEQLAARGELSASGAITQLPMSGAFLGSTFAPLPGESRDPGGEFGADLRGVTPGYFRALGIELVSGRELTVRDARDSTPVAIVDETLARRFWPDAPAVGRHLRWVRTGDVLEIVGVVRAVHHDSMAAAPRETVYRPYSQYAAMPEMYVEARSPLGYEAARRAIVEEVRRLDGAQPVADLRRMDTLVQAAMGQPRFNTLLLTAFAAIATLLAAVGVYGVMSFAVSERTSEIGVRMALGADATAIVSLVVKTGARLTFAGVMVGSLLAAAAGQAIRGLLFGVSPSDPPIFAGVLVFVTLVAMAACGIPAFRAAKLDPTIALRRS